MRKTKVGDVDDVWVAQAARGPRLTLEALHKFFVAHELRGDQFERDITLSAEVCCEIDGSHTTPTQESFEAIFLIKYLTNVLIEGTHARGMLSQTKPGMKD